MTIEQSSHIGVASPASAASTAKTTGSTGRLVQYLLTPVLVTAFLAITSVNTVSWVQAALAFLLLLISWAAFQIWATSERPGPPLFALVAGMHWLYFGVPVFWGDRFEPTYYGTRVRLSDDSITATVAMVLLGVTAIGVGMRTRLLGTLLPSPGRPLRLSVPVQDYLRAVLVVGLFASLFPNAINLLGPSGRNWIIALQTTVPLFVATILLLRYFRNQSTMLDRLLILTYLVTRMFTGLGSGWSGSVFFLGLAVGLVYLLTRRKIPFAAVAVLAVAVIFLQPAKGDFRRIYWYSDNTYQDTLVGRIEFWLSESLMRWQNALADPSSEEFTRYVRNSILRVSLLSHAANVLEKTPETVPFQEGNLYAFTLVGFIPRFIWPDKPSGNDANRFYQVAYGVTPEDRLDNVSIAIGYLTEAYISFGWVGVAGVMYLLGIIFRVVMDYFFRDPDSTILLSIGVVTVVQLMRVETQLGLYLVSALQTSAVCYIVLAPFILIKHRSI